MRTRVLLIAGEGTAKVRYEDALGGLDVDVDAIESVDALGGALAAKAYNGILLDVPTMIKSGPEAKAAVYDLLEMFPVVRLRWDGVAGSIRTLFYGRTTEFQGSLARFIEEECALFPPRTIRSSRRLPVHYNVLLSRSPDLADPERTVTVNVSESGVFLFSVVDYSDTRELWMVVQELEDKTPIRLGVRWQCRWGEDMRLPGVGAAFLAVRPGQIETLRSRLMEQPIS